MAVGQWGVQGLIWAMPLRHRRALFTYGALKKCVNALLAHSLLIRRIISSQVRHSRRVNQIKPKCRKQVHPAILPKAFCNDALFVLFVLRLNVPVNNFSVMSGRSHHFLGNLPVLWGSKVSCSRTQHGGGRFRTPDLSLQSLTLYH